MTVRSPSDWARMHNVAPLRKVRTEEQRLAYALAEEIRWHSRADEVLGETPAWRAGVSRLVETFPDLSEDEANALLGAAMARTAL